MQAPTSALILISIVCLAGAKGLCLQKCLFVILYFRFRFVFINVYILFKKNMDSFALECHNSFQR